MATVERSSEMSRVMGRNVVEIARRMLGYGPVGGMSEGWVTILKVGCRNIMLKREDREKMAWDVEGTTAGLC